MSLLRTAGGASSRLQKYFETGVVTVAQVTRLVDRKSKSIAHAAVNGIESSEPGSGSEQSLDSDMVESSKQHSERPRALSQKGKGKGRGIKKASSSSSKGPGENPKNGGVQYHGPPQSAAVHFPAFGKSIFTFKGKGGSS